MNGLLGMTPRKLERILRDCEKLKFVKTARARHSAMDEADLVVDYESLGAGRMCSKCGYPGWIDTECPACHCDHPAAHAVLLARSKGRGGK